MQLNCKQGDLAIIVKSFNGNEGKIVRCLELLVTDKVFDVNGNTHFYAGGVRPIWRLDRPITFANAYEASQVPYCSDAFMRPLRGDLTDDEIETTKELENV